MRAIRRLLKITCLCAAMSMAATMGASAQGSAETIKELQTEMYRYFSTPEKEKFFDVTDRLKAECLKAADEQSFYRAWGNQAIYEATHQHRNHAVEIAKEMKDYAKSHDSRFGEYTALHVMGSVNLQMQNFDEAEANFLESIEVLHMFFPKESAAPAYLELTKIRNRRNDMEGGRKYALQVLEEPNVAPQHKIRALSMLCQYAFVENDRESYNRYYAMWQEVRQLTAGGSLEPTVEVDYRIINGQYDEALQLCEKVPVGTRDERRAVIYHRMGDDTHAYLSMMRFKAVSDSIARVTQGDLLNDYIVQLNNERLESERLALEEEALAMKQRYWFTLGALLVGLLAYVIYRRTKNIGRLRRYNAQLDEARKEAETARDEAEKALDVKREFLNNISHELRTPLNPITGFSDILATPGFELAPDERATMSQHIKDSSKLLTGMIDHMIELSFYESKTSLPKDDEVSPKVICLGTIDDMRSRVKSGVDLQLASDLPDSVKMKTDMLSVQKILYKLLDNAVKYTDVGAITVGCTEVGDMIRFSVTDTGTGIDPERQEHIFELFAQTNDNIKTMGLGLGICQAIVKLLGGRIWLDRDYTEGSRFVFDIPRA